MQEPDAVLTQGRAEGMGKCMKYLCMLLFSIASLHAQDVVPEQVPQEVMASAVSAVADLGKEVVLGRYQVAVERMYPQWKERTAKRMGGMAELEKQLEAVAGQMQQQGISITDCKPQGQPRGYEVFPGKKVEMIDGRQVETLRYTKWLILVPTVTKFRTFIDGDPRAVTIESTGFQVAISDKGENNWSFIDGSAVSVNDLRSLFLTLPKDMELPPLEKRQIK